MRGLILQAVALTIATGLICAPSIASSKAGSAGAGIPKGAVARVGDELILRDWHRHWQRIARRSDDRSGERAARRGAMIFVIAAEWGEQEAKEREIRVTSRRVRERFRRQRRKAFESRADYREYLRKTGQTTEDVRYRIRLDLYAIAIKRQLQRRDPLPTRAEQQARFRRVLKREYRLLTVCAKGYRVRLCRNS